MYDPSIIKLQTPNINQFSHRIFITQFSIIKQINKCKNHGYHIYYEYLYPFYRHIKLLYISSSINQNCHYIFFRSGNFRPQQILFPCP